MAKKFPSQVKYEQENPTITFRMKIHEKQKIREMARRCNKSVSQLVKTALLGSERDISVAWHKAREEGKQEGIDIGYKNGYAEGGKKGARDWAIWCYCWKCKKAMYIQPNSEDHKTIIEKTEGYLEHSHCPEE